MILKRYLTACEEAKMVADNFFEATFNSCNMGTRGLLDMYIQCLTTGPRAEGVHIGKPRVPKLQLLSNTYVGLVGYLYRELPVSIVGFNYDVLICFTKSAF